MGMCIHSITLVHYMLTCLYRRYLEWSQQRNLNELWHSRDMPHEATGTLQLLEFGTAVYQELLQLEDTILRGNKEVRGICGLRVFARLDIALVWDNRDADSSKHRYRFILNEIQPGDAGLFMLDSDCRTSILRGLVDGMMRGSLDDM